MPGYREELPRVLRTEVERGKSVAAQVKYWGRRFGIVYLELDPFEDKLPNLGALLDEIEERYGEVVALLPNVGLTGTSFLLGTDFQGVKGVAIVCRHSISQR